jgi:hypothetical protein
MLIRESVLAEWYCMVGFPWKGAGRIRARYYRKTRGCCGIGDSARNAAKAKVIYPIKPLSQLPLIVKGFRKLAVCVALTIPAIRRAKPDATVNRK